MFGMPCGFKLFCAKKGLIKLNKCSGPTWKDHTLHLGTEFMALNRWQRRTRRIQTSSCLDYLKMVLYQIMVINYQESLPNWLILVVLAVVFCMRVIWCCCLSLQNLWWKLDQRKPRNIQLLVKLMIRSLVRFKCKILQSYFWIIFFSLLVTMSI